MPDGLVPTQAHVQVHSLLHTNLNTVDVSAAAGLSLRILSKIRSRSLTALGAHRTSITSGTAYRCERPLPRG